MIKNNKKTIGVVIPTWKGIKHLPYCLLPLLKSQLNPRILVVDSSSNDGTVELAQQMGVQVLVIPSQKFNHGTTRELGRKTLDTDIVVMMTQDAYLQSPEMLETLVNPLICGKASVSYARQIPHEGAGYFGSFARMFNYPKTSQVRSLEDIHKYGVYTFFCSNSCAAYLNDALDEIKGFAETLFGEDTLAVAKLLHQGHRVAYVAEALVKHSHDYRLKEEFQRHFDIGLSRAMHRNLLEKSGKDFTRGKKFAKNLIRSLWPNKFHLLPYAILHISAKFLGYQLGKKCLNAPNWLKRKISNQSAYWKR